MPKKKKAKTHRTSDALAILHTSFVDTPRKEHLLEQERERVALGDLIRELRESQGLTQKELAEKIGTTQSAIARIEDANYTGLKLPTIAKIAQALGHRVELTLVKEKA